MRDEKQIARHAPQTGATVGARRRYPTGRSGAGRPVVFVRMTRHAPAQRARDTLFVCAPSPPGLAGMPL